MSFQQHLAELRRNAEDHFQSATKHVNDLEDKVKSDIVPLVSEIPSHPPSSTPTTPPSPHLRTTPSPQPPTHRKSLSPISNIFGWIHNPPDSNSQSSQRISMGGLFHRPRTPQPTDRLPKKVAISCDGDFLVFWSSEVFTRYQISTGKWSSPTPSSENEIVHAAVTSKHAATIGNIAHVDQHHVSLLLLRSYCCTVLNIAEIEAATLRVGE